MPASPQRNPRDARREHARNLHLRAQSFWGYDPNPEGLRTSVTMTIVGAAALAAFAVALVNGDARYATLLLLLGVALFLFGGLTLVVAFIEWTIKRVMRTRKYCGRCVFYQPQDEDYDVGLCRADPREGFVQRTHSCPYFRYSERAMVRVMLWHRRVMLDVI